MPGVFRRQGSESRSQAQGQLGRQHELEQVTQARVPGEADGRVSRCWDGGGQRAAGGERGWEVLVP